MNSRKKKSGFNELLMELEKIVEHLEDNETSLEASLEAFEKGIALSRQAQKLLTEAEQKVIKLTESDDGEVQIEGFQDEDSQ